MKIVETLEIKFSLDSLVKYIDSRIDTLKELKSLHFHGDFNYTVYQAKLESFVELRNTIENGAFDSFEWSD